MTSAETNTAVTVAEQGANVASDKASSKKAATRKKGSGEGQKAAKGSRSKAAAPKQEAKASRKSPKPARAKEARTPRSESKGAKILAMIGRAKGASLGEIMRAVAWQAHSVRGYLSTAAKKQRIKIESAKDESGDRVYRIAKVGTAHLPPPSAA